MNHIRFYQPLMCRRFTIWRARKPTETLVALKVQLRPIIAHCYQQIHIIKAKLCHFTPNNQIFVKVYFIFWEWNLYVICDIIFLWECFPVFKAPVVNDFGKTDCFSKHTEETNFLLHYFWRRQNRRLIAAVILSRCLIFLIPIYRLANIYCLVTKIK